MATDVPQIVGNARTIDELLSGNNRYTVSFYQREYSWEYEQVTQLIDDLVSEFQNQYDQEESHKRENVASYRPYFLGPIILESRDGIRHIVDGQQRITTLGLLLMYLRQNLTGDEKEQLAPLIYTHAFGSKTFKLDIEEREKCLNAILEDQEFDIQSEESVSVRNLWRNYKTINDYFPEDLHGEALPYFFDWLTRRVMLVDISVTDRIMAETVFETMNDRGLRLSNTDMLKSSLIAQAEESEIQRLNELWRRRITELKDVDENADSEFIKTWLRSKYAETRRESKRGASPGDFDDIGTAFHKWVRNNCDRIGLVDKDDYRRFVECEFLGLSGRYVELRKASRELVRGLESVRHVAYLGFTLQFLAMLAAITHNDDDTEFLGKASLIAKALDIFVVRRMVNYQRFGYDTSVRPIFNLVKKLREQPVSEVKKILAQWLKDQGSRLDVMFKFGLHQRNKKHVRYILARITGWLSDELDTGETFVDYVDPYKRNPYQIEHVWANHFERHKDEFPGEWEFQQYRDRIGGLLLLPRDYNISFNDMIYHKKLEHYNGQNPLARSLHPNAYKNNPRFDRLRQAHSLDFVPYPSDFTRKSIDERSELYRRLAEIIWNPAELTK